MYRNTGHRICPAGAYMMARPPPGYETAARVACDPSAAMPAGPLHEAPSNSKICGVCGDRAKSLHFGGMACDSCKAFFRRSVQNEAYKHFRCAYEDRCHITMTSRKSCQSCRFNKCVDIGMEKSWVMTEAERNHQLKEKKRQQQNEAEMIQSVNVAGLRPDVTMAPHQARLCDRHLYLNQLDVKEIQLLLDMFYSTYQASPPPVDVIPELMSCRLRLVNVFINTISRLVQYVSNLPRFRQICDVDKPILLKHGVLAMTILRGTMVYDSSNSFFSLKTRDRCDSGATISFNEIKSVLTDDLCHNHFKFIKSMKQLRLDETTLMLLQMIVLFSTDRIGLTNTTVIAQHQEVYTELLHKYMMWCYGRQNTKVLYPKVLHRLTDLRSLTEAHSDQTVHIPDPDFSKVVASFSQMQLSPYPEWNCLERGTYMSGDIGGLERFGEGEDACAASRGDIAVTSADASLADVNCVGVSGSNATACSQHEVGPSVVSSSLYPRQHWHSNAQPDSTSFAQPAQQQPRNRHHLHEMTDRYVFPAGAAADELGDCGVGATHDVTARSHWQAACGGLAAPHSTPLHASVAAFPPVCAGGDHEPVLWPGDSTHHPSQQHLLTYDNERNTAQQHSFIASTSVAAGRRAMNVSHDGADGSVYVKSESCGEVAAAGRLCDDANTRRHGGPLHADLKPLSYAALNEPHHHLNQHAEQHNHNHNHHVVEGTAAYQQPQQPDDFLYATFNVDRHDSFGQVQW